MKGIQKTFAKQWLYTILINIGQCSICTHNVPSFISPKWNYYYYFNYWCCTFSKKKKKSKSKLDLQICKVNQGIVLFLFGFSPTGHKKFHLPQFSKKNTTEFKRHKLQKKNLLFKINQNSRSFVLVWITISSFLKCQLTKPPKKG